MSLILNYIALFLEIYRQLNCKPKEESTSDFVSIICIRNVLPTRYKDLNFFP
jgi:hypothetical protein